MGRRRNGASSRGAYVLAGNTAARYLVERGILDPSEVAAGEIEVGEFLGRNRCVQVLRGARPGYFLKQAPDVEARGLVAHEAAAYAQLRRPGTELSGYMPQPVAWDPAAGILVLETIPGARTLGEQQRRTGSLSARAAGELARCLAALHRTGSGHPSPFFSSRPVPGPHPALWLNLPDLSAFRSFSGGNVQLIARVQALPDLERGLDGLRASWICGGLVHHDVTWENCLLVPDEAPSRRSGTRLQLIDWELVELGDPGWDVGAVFAGFLAWWVESLPGVGGLTPERLAARARYPPSRFQPAVRAFWSVYTRCMQFDGAASEERLRRATGYAAAFLVHLAFGHLEQAASITPVACRLVDVACNVLRRPREAAAHLLGLPWRGSGFGAGLR